MEHLTNGWEPELDPGDSLLRRFVLANADRATTLAELAGGRAMRTPAFAAADPESPVLFDNAAVLLQPGEYVDLASAIDEIVGFYPADRHFVVLSAFPTPDLGRHGLELMGHPPLMYRPAGGSAPLPPAGLEIVEVRTAEQLGEFVETLVEAYPMPGAQGTVLADERILQWVDPLLPGHDRRPPGGDCGSAHRSRDQRRGMGLDRRCAPAEGDRSGGHLGGDAGGADAPGDADRQRRRAAGVRGDGLHPSVAHDDLAPPAADRPLNRGVTMPDARGPPIP